MVWDYDTNNVKIPLVQNEMQEIQNFYCNNCLFADINVTYVDLFKIQHVVFDQCTFQNIFTESELSVILSGAFEIDIPHQYTLIFEECDFINISSNNFIKFVDISDEFVEFQPKLIINNSNIISNSDSLMVFIRDESYFTMIDSSFFYGNVVVIDTTNKKKGEAYIYLDNVDIETTQYFNTITDSETFYPSFQTAFDSILLLKNIFVTFKTECYSNLYYYQIGIYCHSPMPLLYNRGYAILQNVTIKTEYDRNKWMQYKDGMYLNLGVSYGPSTSSTDQYFCAIINMGALSIDNMYIDEGAHYSILCDFGTAVSINNIITKWFSNNEIFYDKFSLKPVGFLYFNGGSIEIQNSKLAGFSVFTVLLLGSDILGGGQFIMEDSTILLAGSAIQSFSQFANKISLNNIHIYNVGFYYQFIGARRYIYSFYPSIYLSANNITITKCNFSFISKKGMMVIDSIGISNYDASTKYSVEPNVLIQDTAFYIDGRYNESFLKTFYNITWTTPAQPEFVYAFPYYKSLMAWWYRNNGNDTEIDLETLKPIIHDNGIIFINGYTHIVFVNNILQFGNQQIAKQYKSWPFIYFNTSTTDNCLSSNIISNYAIYIKKGTIKSCKHFAVDAINNNTPCWTWYGITNKQYDSNIFRLQYDFDDHVQSQIVIASNLSYLILDDVEFMDRTNLTNYNNSVIDLRDGKLSIIDSYINSMLLNYAMCGIRCFEVIDDNISNIRQVHFDCSINNSNYTEYNYVSYHYGIPSKVLLISSGDLYPGGAMDVELVMIDKFGNVIVDEIYDIQPITVILQSDPLQLNINTKITITDWPYYTFIYVQAATKFMIANTYTLHASMVDDIMEINDINITITACPVGFGLIGDQRQCTKCAKGTFSMNINNGSCLECGNNDGVFCDTESQISVKYGYWMNIVQQDNDDNLESFAIISSLCLNAYCCANKNGCKYQYKYDNDDNSFMLVNESQNNLCAVNRNVDIYFCGECNPFYSELFATQNCGTCEDYYWQRMLLPISYGFLWFLYIILSRSDPIHEDVELNDNDSDGCCENKSNCCKYQLQIDTDRPEQKLMTKSEYTNSLEVMLSKSLLYYYQSFYYLNLQIALNGFLALFNLDIFSLNLDLFSGNSDFEGYCLYPGMTMFAKILIPLSVTISIIIFIFTAWVFSVFPCICCRINVLKVCKRKPNFGQILIKTFLICVGQLFSVLMTILSCRSFTNNTNVHFFFGSISCYCFRWWIALVTLLVSVIIFCALFLKINNELRCESIENENKEETGNEIQKKYYYATIWCFRQRYWYFEIILFFRRLVLAIVFIVVESNEARIITAMCLGIYLFFHSYIQPFKTKYENYFESLLIGSISAAIFIDAVYQNDILNKTRNTIMSLLILLPIIFVLIYAVWKCKAFFREDNINNTNYLNLNQNNNKPQGIAIGVDGKIQNNTTDNYDNNVSSDDNSDDNSEQNPELLMIEFAEIRAKSTAL